MKFSLRLCFAVTAAAGTLLSYAAEESAPAEPEMHDYQIAELVPVINRGLKGGRNFNNGQRLFREVGCAMCHQFAGEQGGGIGPDLTGAGGRFGIREILESILEPSAVVSDLHGTKIVGLKDGTTLTGKVALEGNEEIGVIENYTVNPETGTAEWTSEKMTMVKSATIDYIDENPESVMPAGMINSLKQDDVVDLFAYLISAGNASNAMYKPVAP